nr:MAG TPA: hypothetical protein [Caudoviricetes sp.]
MHLQVLIAYIVGQENTLKVEEKEYMSLRLDLEII